MAASTACKAPAAMLSAHAGEDDGIWLPSRHTQGHQLAISSASASQGGSAHMYGVPAVRNEEASDTACGKDRPSRMLVSADYVLRLYGVRAYYIVHIRRARAKLPTNPYNWTWLAKT